MNKVTTINLGGNAYQLEESGYEALRAYLESAARRLEGNPDRDEIIADIEQAIADKFRAVLAAYKTVVVTKEVEKIIAEMGPVQDASDDSDDASSARQAAAPGAAGGQPAADGPGRTSGTPKRLYRIQEGAMISGVCNGLAAYFNLDVTIIRIAFTLLTFIWGTGILVYFLMALIVPTAGTPEEKAAAHGDPSTAQEFIRRAKAGYYEGMKNFPDREARREWKRKFKQEMRGWQRDFQRNMHENSQQWEKNWHHYWAQHPPFYGAPSAIVPFLWLINALLFLLGMAAAISLLTTGAVFGVVLPAGVPVWGGLVFLFVLYLLLAWPFKVMRHACYYHGMYRPGYFGPVAALWGMIVWLAFLALLVVLADRYMPQVHEALKNLPPVIHQAVDAVQQWWNRR